MLIFNCSKAFAKFITPRASSHAGPLVKLPRASNLWDEAALLRLEHGRYAENIQQWQAHVIEEQGRSCVVAVEVDTRFAMIFTMLEPGRQDLFIYAFIERLFTLQWLAAEALGLVSWREREVWLRNFLGAHQKSCFVLRTDRSVQAHVNEVVRDFASELDMRDGAFPVSSRECTSLDLSFNDRLRRTKHNHEYFSPDEAMLIHWLEAYGGWTHDGTGAARATIRERCRQTGLRMRDLAAGIV
jgi:hypothetical protein